MLDKFLAIAFNKITLGVTAVFVILFGSFLKADYKPVECTEDDCLSLTLFGCLTCDTQEKLCYNFEACWCNAVFGCFEGVGEGACTAATCITDCTGECYDNTEADDNFAGCIRCVDGTTGCSDCLDTYCTDENGGFAINCEGRDTDEEDDRSPTVIH